MRNKYQQIELIKTLSNAFGPSGLEDEVSQIVFNEINDLSDVHEDTLRNVTARLNNDPNQLNVMLDAHLDEVGFIVQAVKPNGTLSFYH